MCPPSSNLPRFYSSDASAYTFFRTVRTPSSRPTPRRRTPIRTTALPFLVRSGREGEMSVWLTP